MGQKCQLRCANGVREAPGSAIAHRAGPTFAWIVKPRVSSATLATPRAPERDRRHIGEMPDLRMRCVGSCPKFGNDPWEKAVPCRCRSRSAQTAQAVPESDRGHPRAGVMTGRGSWPRTVGDLPCRRGMRPASGRRRPTIPFHSLMGDGSRKQVMPRDRPREPRRIHRSRSHIRSKPYTERAMTLGCRWTPAEVDHPPGQRRDRHSLCSLVQSPRAQLRPVTCTPTRTGTPKRVLYAHDPASGALPRQIELRPPRTSAGRRHSEPSSVDLRGKLARSPISLAVLRLTCAPLHEYCGCGREYK